MSYILEALKKAQAERQLGNAPTIHAPAPSYAAPASTGNRKPLLVGLGAGALVVAAGAAFLLRQPPAVAPAPSPVQVASVVAPTVVASVQEPAPAIIVPAPVEPAADAPKPKETASRARPDVAAPVAKAPRRADPEPPGREEAVEAIPEAPRAAVLPATQASADDSVGPVQSLPEAVQREVPKVAFGGYIYSPNPAERLLLVDKTLRREGEEVAPGLVLERLLPKAAIMNFRGYRYRVAY